MRQVKLPNRGPWLTVAGIVSLAAGCSHGQPIVLAPAPTAYASSQVDQWRNQFERKTVATEAGDLVYRIASGKGASPHPLILVLHGSGAMGRDNEKQLGAFAASWAQLLDDDLAPDIVVPQVEERSATYQVCDKGPCDAAAGPSFPKLLALFDQISASDTNDARQVFIVGFSMGASAALQLAAARPTRITGLVAFSPVPPARAVSSPIVQVPVTIVHSDADPENPYLAARRWASWLRAAGGRVTFCTGRAADHQVADAWITDPGWRQSLIRSGHVPCGHGERVSVKPANPHS